jgi:BarA-like signal transduction histidine kinase
MSKDLESFWALLAERAVKMLPAIATYAGPGDSSPFAAYDDSLREALIAVAPTVGDESRANSELLLRAVSANDALYQALPAKDKVHVDVFRGTVLYRELCAKC